MVLLVGQLPRLIQAFRNNRRIPIVKYDAMVADYIWRLQLTSYREGGSDRLDFKVISGRELPIYIWNYLLESFNFVRIIQLNTWARYPFIQIFLVMAIRINEHRSGNTSCTFWVLAHSLKQVQSPGLENTPRKMLIHFGPTRTPNSP